MKTHFLYLGNFVFNEVCSTVMTSTNTLSVSDTGLHLIVWDHWCRPSALLGNRDSWDYLQD